MARRFRYRNSSPRRRSYPRRFFRRRGRKSTTIPILPLAAGIAPLFSAYNRAGQINGIMSNPTNFMDAIIYDYTGMQTNGQLDTKKLVQNMTMWVAAGAGHFILNRIGVNRAFKHVPLIGKYVSI